MPLFFAVFLAGFIGGGWAFSSSDMPETMKERLSGKAIWVVGALAGLALWLWKGRR